MILLLANYYSRRIAVFFWAVFYLSLIVPALGSGNPYYRHYSSAKHSRLYSSTKSRLFPSDDFGKYTDQRLSNKVNLPKDKFPRNTGKRRDIGGPNQPEMASFKSVGTDNMVNLFTGDFSYNIPLLDVGGYPVNIFYSGGVSPEQEASWVGLGWNINPGNINRNMRGIPDDFNGQDTLLQMQMMKPNKTWGFGVGADIELIGIKLPVKTNLGVAFNNYLGPSLDLSVRGTASFKIAGNAGSEKSVGAGLTLGVGINSRSGVSFSGNFSLTGNAQMQNNTLSFGAGVSTGYNSRSGIKALQISEQGSFNSNAVKHGVNKNFEWYDYKVGGGFSNTLYSTAISFAKPSYIPSLRMPLTNTAWSGHFQLGLGSFGVAADVEAEVYGQKSEIADADTLQKKPMVGYLYYQNAVNNPGYIMDFSRFNDREVTPNTPVISAPQYSYDVFSIQGEGTGGSIRAYRNDLGYVRDNMTVSKDKNISVGGDVDPPGHYGGNVNIIKTPSTIGEWNAGNKLRNSIQFTKAKDTYENVYFRNPGESSVLDSNQLKNVGGTDLVRFVLGGRNNAPTVEPKLQSFNSVGKIAPAIIDLTKITPAPERNKRTQVISFLSAEEAAVAGLDKMIKSYDNQNFLDNVKDTLIYEPIARVDGKFRKAHHISQINVTESNGRRYVYGVPVYNLTQKDFTFSVNNNYGQIPDKVNVNQDQMNAGSGLLKDKSERDGYIQITTTPAYAHSFLLSGILSPDYVDVTNNGITEDDLGDAVKFNYSRIKNGADIAHKWRTPLTLYDSANFNAGLRSEVKDDKAIISYGERESWYLQSVESKTMIALFYVSDRADGKGATSIYGGVNSNDHFSKKLDSIALYSKADLKVNGLVNARPVKTVHFAYSYLLCQNTPDNPSGAAGSKGKLTLDSIYFTYNGKTRAKKNKYIFSYSSSANDNPDYSFSSSDRWGTYKPQSMNPGSLKNADYPYSIQDTANKNIIDQNAAAWMLKKIVLPSGGQIEVNYESDDYAFVQNRRASAMMKIVGFGYTSDLSMASDRLYNFTGTNTENDYVFIRVPSTCSTLVEVKEKYLQGVNQLAFKIWVQMPKGPEYIPCYATYSNYGFVSSDHSIVWVKLDRVGGKSPLSITALEYLRQQLPGQAFPGYDISGEPPLKQAGDMLLSMLYSLRDAFSDPINAFRKDSKAMRTDLTKCFVRLNDPDGYKYGGGYRVKSVMLKDNWNVMTGQYTSMYGQKYNYTTTESFNGSVRTISSGVASYEPSIGGEENPFQAIIQVEDYLPLGPTSYGAVEMPVLDAFFPAPSVGYSKVTVSSIKSDTISTKKSRSGIGKQVTEFYTAKDFPVYYSFTPFDEGSIKEFHQASTLAFFNKYAYDYKAQSQGFLIATNDMHGKMRSQSSYADNDSATRISYTENFYRNTGVNGMNETFSFINKQGGGSVSQGNMGIDVELMTDTREFSVKSNSLEMQGQVDIFYFGPIIIPIPTIWPVSGTTENIYRSVTTTKVINYHSVLDSMIVIDKGSQVTTRNLVYDAQTGEVLITRTNNEFNQAIYNTSYPAHWAYGGMGPAYKNIDAVYTGVNFSDGKIINAGFDQTVFESGDELLIKSAGIPSGGCDAQIASGNIALVWAFDRNKNITSLITTPDFIFIDAGGKPYTMANVSFRVIRSGHRNMLDAKTSALTSMTNPVLSGKLIVDANSKVINASAAEFKEKWQADNDVIKKLKIVTDPYSCIKTEVQDTSGYLEKKINPYCKGLIGNFKPYRSLVFYDNRMESDTTASTNISANGFLKNFKLYWDFNTQNNLEPDTSGTQWVWNSRITKTNAKGLELETQDALGVYTSAQYGYNKTIPVAIANNARYNEMFAEGFEDYGYGETLSNTMFNINRRHIDFSKLPNSLLINTDTANFKAHSGKYVLSVNASSSATQIVPLKPGVTDNFSLIMNKDTLKQLTGVGGILTKISAIPASAPTYTPSFSTSNLGMSLDFGGHNVTGEIVGNTVRYFLQYKATQYTRISTPNTYSFNLSTNQFDVPLNYPADYIFNMSTLTVSIRKMNGDLVTSFNANSFTSPLVFPVFLTCDTFKIESLCTVDIQRPYDGSNGFHAFQADFGYSSNTGTTSYQSLAADNSCIFNKPIAATDSMFNPTFTATPGKKMVFSAWVKENCGNAANGIPCREFTYTHNQVQVKFGAAGGDTSFNPVGPIIDGWQLYEGVFTIPAGANTMSLHFMNSGAGPVYFDDIRIHPFNANMKSYVYDPVSLRLVAELDANNYTSFYEYDEEGTLIRTKAETKEGIKTIRETRSSLQKVIQNVIQ